MAATPVRIKKVRIRAGRREEIGPAAEAPAKNSVIRVTRAGRRPLQGTKLLVRMAMSRSLGESMIRQPVTPAALHPKPIAIVRACFPQALQHWKGRSRLYAIRGR